MIEVHLTIIEEVDEQETEMKTKEKAREQFKNKIYQIALNNRFETNKETYDKIEDLVRGMSWSIAKPPESTWSEQVDKEVVEYIKDHLLDNIVSGLQSYDDITTLFDWHRNHSNAFYEMSEGSYGEQEALDLIHELSSFEETEQYLIGDGDIADQLSNKATWTYSNAVYNGIEEKLKSIADAIDIDEITFDIALSLLNDDDKHEIDIEDVDTVVEYTTEHYEDEFDKQLKDALHKRVLEEL